MRKFLGQFKQQAFIVFLVISILLWFFNRLGNRFTTEIDIPVHIVNDFGSNVWIEEPNIKVGCVAEGEGRTLILYKFGLIPSLDILASELVFLQDPDTTKRYRSMIRPASVQRVLTLGIKDINFIQINDSSLTVNVSPMGEARLPVHSNIKIESYGQYMQVGQTILTPDSVNIKAPLILLDSLTLIETESIHFTRAKMGINGTASLKIPQNVISSVTSVRYSADVTSYTEVEYKLPVEIENLTSNLGAIIVPSTVDVLIRVPLRSYHRQSSQLPVASIDYAIRHENLSPLFAVKIDSLPQGFDIISYKPEFVEVFFEPIHK